MTPATAAASGLRPAASGRSPASALAPLVAAIGLATALALAAAVGSGDPFASLAPVLVLGALVTAWFAPLRVTLLAAMFVGLAADRPGDSQGRWASPIVSLGGLAFQNLNKLIDIEWLKFSGVFLLLACLLVVHAYRVLSRGSRDRAAIRPAAPLHWAISISALTLLAAAAFGWIRGGDVQMAKIQTQGFLQVLAAAYLFSVSLRGPRDYRIAGTLIVAAACIKATMAVWVTLTLPAEFPNQWGVMEEMEYATSHGDSLLFAAAIAVLVAPLVDRPGARQLRWAILLMPLLMLGLYANDRRIGWAQAGLVVVVLVLMNLRTLLTRRTVRLGMMLSPLVLAYVLVGWSSSSRVFAPVRLVRGLVVQQRTDGSIDRSTLYRDVENYNLVYTFRSNPLLGTGFGHPFRELAKGDDISVGFREYAYLPHNSILALWAFSGAAGFTGILAAVLVALFLAARAHAHAALRDQRIAAAASFSCITAYLLHCWGDIGFTEATAIFVVGLAMAVAGQMAADADAWPARWRRHAARYRAHNR
jgi:hypothetical protein